MIGKRKIIDGKYYSFLQNKNLSNIIETYKIKFAKETVDSNTSLDKIALKYYGEEKYWQILCIFNSIVDPLTELDDKREIVVPLNINEWIDKL